MIASTPTNLASTVDRMISYRHQEHSWQTGDGALHLMMNRGRLEPSGLTLYSSYDGGTTWVAQLNWPEAGQDSTADGQLRGDLLSVAYSTAAGGIIFNELRYDPVARSWQRNLAETVFSPTSSTAENPTIGVDGVGATWIAYVSTDTATGAPRINLASRAAGVSPWIDTGLVFGSVGVAGVGRSARMVPVPGGMAMLYKVEETLYWGTRTDGQPINAPWTQATMFVSPPPAPRDPYASHFSIVADSQNNLHLVMADDGLLYYFRYGARQLAWGPGRVLDGTAQVSYCQLTVTADDRLIVVYNNASSDSRVLLSTNRGVSFTSTALLRPTPVAGATYTYSRLETPSRSTLPLPVLRQFAEGRTNKLMLFSVPLP